MKSKTLLASIGLLLTALFWGLSYSAQSKAMASLQPLVFVSLRYIIGSLTVLIPLLFLRKMPLKEEWIFGGLCGLFLAGGEILQQFGLLYTEAGKTGFLTSLYVILIPLLGMLGGKKTKLIIWIAAIFSVAGAFLLSYNPAEKAFGNKGDFLVLCCALFFAFQFMALAKFAPRLDALRLAFVQGLTVAVLSGISSLCAGEIWEVKRIMAGGIPLLYCGCIAVGIACTIQVAAQKYVPAAACSIILSTASIFAVAWGMLLLGEKYSLANLAGCGLILLGVILVQLPEKKKS